MVYSLRNMGRIRELTGNLVEAVAAVEEAKKWARCAEDSLNEARASSQLGRLYVKLESTEAAIQAYEDAVTVFKEVISNHATVLPELAEAQFELSRLFRSTGDLKRALKQRLDAMNAFEYLSRFRDQCIEPYGEFVLLIH